MKNFLTCLHSPILCLLQLQHHPSAAANTWSWIYARLDLGLLFLSILILFRNQNLNASMVQTRKPHPGQNLRYRAIFFLLMIMFNVCLHQPISLHYKNNKNQTLTEPKAGGCSSFIKS